MWLSTGSIQVRDRARLLSISGTRGAAAKEAAAIAKALGNYAVTCKSIDLEASLKKAEDRVAMLNNKATAELDKSIVKFLNGYKAFKASDGSAAIWNSLIYQNGRSVSNSVRQLDAYNKKFWGTFKNFQGFDLGTMKLTDDDGNTKTKRQKIAKLAKDQVVEIAKFKP